jgi:hypothetical protein
MQNYEVGHQLNRPIRVRPAARCAVMPGHEIDRRGLVGLAAFAAQATKQIFEGHIARAFYQQPHRREDGTASTVQTMQLDHALGPVRQSVRPAK